MSASSEGGLIVPWIARGRSSTLNVSSVMSQALKP